MQRNGLTAGVTGKGGNWRTKLPDAESAVWGRYPESVGECPHLSGARGVGLLLWEEAPHVYSILFANQGYIHLVFNS
jgi:hypothetical protein